MKQLILLVLAITVTTASAVYSLTHRMNLAQQDAQHCSISNDAANDLKVSVADHEASQDTVLLSNKECRSKTSE
ncbi:MAG: hypothetical protein ABJ327_02440 [Litoreibacter sp.]